MFPGFSIYILVLTCKFISKWKSTLVSQILVMTGQWKLFSIRSQCGSYVLSPKMNRIVPLGLIKKVRNWLDHVLLLFCKILLFFLFIFYFIYLFILVLSSGISAQPFFPWCHWYSWFHWTVSIYVPVPEMDHLRTRLLSHIYHTSSLKIDLSEPDLCNMN